MINPCSIFILRAALLPSIVALIAFGCTTPGNDLDSTEAEVKGNGEIRATAGTVIILHADETLTVNGTHVPEPDLTAHLAEAGLESDSPIVLRIRPHAPQGTVIILLEDLERSGFTSIFIEAEEARTRK